MNDPEDSHFTEKKKKKCIPSIITSMRSDDVTVTSLETTLSRTTSEKVQQYSA